MKPAWPAEPTLSIPTLLTAALRVTPLHMYYKARIFSYADMLPVMSILYIIVVKFQVEEKIIMYNPCSLTSINNDLRQDSL